MGVRLSAIPSRNRSSRHGMERGVGEQSEPHGIERGAGEQSEPHFSSSHEELMSKWKWSKKQELSNKLHGI